MFVKRPGSVSRNLIPTLSSHAYWIREGRDIRVKVKSSDLAGVNVVINSVRTWLNSKCNCISVSVYMLLSSVPMFAYLVIKKSAKERIDRKTNIRGNMRKCHRLLKSATKMSKSHYVKINFLTMYL